MRERDALLCDGLSESEANRIVVLLASMGIESVLDADSYGALAVNVSLDDLDAARRVLSEEPHAPSAPERSLDPHDLPVPDAWFGRGSGAVLALVAACVAVSLLTVRGEGVGMRARMLELGAIDGARIVAGEYWRFATAVFLHFDIGHLFANMAVLIVVGPPLAHLVGPWALLLVFLTSGVGANVVSYLVAPTLGLKAGASGAIAGVLGALGGQALRPSRLRRRKPWLTLGALAAIYGLVIGFGPRSDHVAHVAGLLIGLALGRRIEPTRGERLAQG